MIKTLDDFCAALEWATELFYLRWRIDEGIIQASIKIQNGLHPSYPLVPITAICMAEERRWHGHDIAITHIEIDRAFARQIAEACELKMDYLDEWGQNIRREILRTILRTNARQKALLANLEKRK